ncbi:MAG: ribonuclease III [Thermodesulfobacteria bacterium]|nr:ribonuclease III [Thermodesulfobacteriota bacterium]
MPKDLKEFEKILDVEFSNPQLLQTALTHRSYKISHRELKLEDNERLEFLGDSVLNLCISKMLFEKYPEDTEGELTKKRAYLVCKTTLIKVAKKIKLLDYIFLGRREEKLDTKSKENISARALEALIGAIFLEKGFEYTCEKIRKWFSPYLRRFPKTPFHDYKTRLQEILQKEFHERPTYEVVSISGPPHNPVFEVVVKLKDKVLAKAKGGSKKEAENLAAKKAINVISTEQAKKH